jgi:hypothetical protein
MPGPGEPGPFSLEDPQHVDELLRGAGFTQIEAAVHEETVALPSSKIESLVSLSSRVGPVREALRTADAATAASIEQAVRQALVERIANDEVRLSASALIVSASA